jgi:hypothetical protein
MEESCFFLYVNLNGLRANRYELMKMYLFFHKNHIGLTETLQHYFVYREKFSLSAHWRLQGTLLYILGEGVPGFLTF